MLGNTYLEVVALTYASTNLEADGFNCPLPSHYMWLTCFLVWGLWDFLFVSQKNKRKKRKNQCNELIIAQSAVLRTDGLKMGTLPSKRSTSEKTEVTVKLFP